MSDENEMDYPEDYRSPDKPKASKSKEEDSDKSKGKDHGDSQKSEEEKQGKQEKPTENFKSPKNDNSGQNYSKRASLELDEKERAAMRWLNEGEAMRPLIDESPYVRKYKEILYNLAKRC